MTPDSRLDGNKRTVEAFYEMAVNDKDFEAASTLMGLEYVAHNPVITGGKTVTYTAGLVRRPRGTA